ncbi:MAG: hypothetical protein P4M10_08775, partial [Verrucomicrobiae bacterium]|nr:hypothetical protein [Verrucomicrobiae bacterium]
LSYQETDYPVTSWSLSITPQTSAFTREPSVPPGHLVRGVLNLGGDTNNALAFLWQRDQGKLYLDLNHNRDFGDDSNNVFSTELARESSFQTFTNIHLTVNVGGRQLPVRGDIELWNFGLGNGGSLAVRSFLTGKAVFQGHDWQVGLVPAVWTGTGGGKGISLEKGQLLLRPGEHRSQAFKAFGGSLETMAKPAKLFFDGQTYQLNLNPGPANGEFKPELVFLEQAAVLGDLKLAGKYIKRLVLPGNNCEVLLDRPAEIVKIPVGTYRTPSVVLEVGGKEAYVQGYFSEATTSVVVAAEAKAPAVLAVGGPLTNSVTAVRKGKNLNLNYRILGAGGMVYQMMEQDRSKPPQFAVYRGAKKIASGEFEFG